MASVVVCVKVVLLFASFMMHRSFPPITVCHDMCSPPFGFFAVIAMSSLQYEEIDHSFEQPICNAASLNVNLELSSRYSSPKDKYYP